MKARSLLTALSFLAMLRVAAAQPALHTFVPGRQNLVVPDSIWDRALEGVGIQGTLGFTADQSLLYNPDDLILRSVWQQFRNVRNIPRYTGQLSQTLIDSARATGALVRQAFATADISAGRMMPVTPDSMLTPFDSLVLRAPAASRPTLRALPPHVQIFIRRLAGAVSEAEPWVELAYPTRTILDALGLKDRAQATPDTLYAFATKPWTSERLGLEATREAALFDLMHRVDRKYLDFASVLLCTNIDFAIAQFQHDDSTAHFRAPAFARIVIPMAFGDIAITGGGDDVIDRTAALTLDLGGNDKYSGRQGVPQSLAQPISVVVDLSGDDVYEETTKPAAMACGLFGIGAIYDLGGNDRYHVRESGLGCAWYGMGILADFSGNDTYAVDSTWGEGTAQVGAGILVDFAGNDSYTCASNAEGLGLTLGVGILLDLEGNDTYLARDDGAISALYLNQSVSMSQGVGLGRRADLGDGHSLAGGVGILVDAAGDDSYSAPVWSQGAGYWWGMGILEDRSGNDHYRSGKYSIGAAAHFAIGVKVDLEGDDTYAVGYDSAKNQYLGHARDGSIGISIDGDGNDAYNLRSHCGGSGDLGSIALFWDRRGNDRYTMLFKPPADSNGWGDTPPLGTTTTYPPYGNWRDDMNTIGIFLDTGGDDTYTFDDKSSKNFYSAVKPANNAAWKSMRSPNSRGAGIDVEWFARGR